MCKVKVVHSDSKERTNISSGGAQQEGREGGKAELDWRVRKVTCSKEL